jgi:hypothetical protein
MTCTIVVLCSLLAATVPAHSDTLGGDWIATVSDKQPEWLEFMLRLEPNQQNGTQFKRSDFTGLTDAQVGSDSRVPVTFALQREAGTISFEGTFRREHGAGEFTFVPNRDFPARLRALGVEFTAPRWGDETEQLFALTMFDVTSAFIRSMQRTGYRESLEMYEQFRIFGVDTAYVRDMASVGFQNLSAQKLVETRIHGATPEYIRRMRAAGDDLPLDEYIQSRIFQVTPEFAAEMKKAGYPDLDRDILTQFRIHGVNAAFVRELAEAGYTRVPAQKLVEMKIHGVTPEFIHRVEQAGYHHVPIDKLVQMRIFDIEPEMVRALDDGGRNRK